MRGMLMKCSGLSGVVGREDEMEYVIMWKAAKMKQRPGFIWSLCQIRTASRLTLRMLHAGETILIFELNVYRTAASSKPYHPGLIMLPS